MELHEAHDLKEVYSVSDATKAIQQDGWKLLAVTAVNHPDPLSAIPSGRLINCYVLGKRQKKEIPPISPRALS